jgi:DNA-binding CsgD family transcriptional regulator/RecA/RadA recombinase
VRGPLVGRDRKLAALRRWLEELDDRAGRLVLVAGEPGIGKTRLVTELVALALADGRRVALGRAAEEPGAPPLWPWHEILRGLDASARPARFAGGLTPDDRFLVADQVATTVLEAAGKGLVVVLEDAHSADRSSLLVLRHLADRLGGTGVLLVVTFRSTGRPTALHEALPALARSISTERLELQPLDEEGVGAQLQASVAEVDASLVAAVYEATGGNPFFVEQLARAIGEGRWRAGKVPESVLEVVRSRLAPLPPPVRKVLGCAALFGRTFELGLVADAAGATSVDAMAALDEAIAHGFVEATGEPGAYRFVHALTRNAVEADLDTPDRLALQRRVAEAIESRYGEDLGDHLGTLARIWLALAGAGGEEQARRWAPRAAAEAVRRTAYEDAATLYRAALAVPGPITDADRCRLLVGLGRACFLAGDLPSAADVAQAARVAARASGDVALQAEAAFVLEAGTDRTVTAVARELCDDALAALGTTSAAYDGVRARLLALRSHAAFYETDLERARSLGQEALTLAGLGRRCRPCRGASRSPGTSPGPGGRQERLRLAEEMLAVARRTGSGRTAMWGRLWRLDALVEQGDLEAAEAQLAPLRLAVEQVGGPVSAWLLGRSTACVAQARADFASASDAARRAFERMHAIEPQAARGAYLALRCAVSHHVGASDESVGLARQPFESPPRFTAMGRVGRAFILTRAGLRDEALVEYRHAGPVDGWRFPPFGVVSCFAIGAMAAAALDRGDDLAALLERLEPYRGHHATIGSGVVNYLGPVELHLGVGALALGRTDSAVGDLRAALRTSRRSNTPGFVAEAAHHLAVALLAHGSPRDVADAGTLADESGTLIDALGMGALEAPSAALRRRLAGATSAAALSAREHAVAALVAEGLSNRGIAERLVISERTAQNHVQRILTKLQYTSRSQIAAWVVRHQR